MKKFAYVFALALAGLPGAGWAADLPPERLVSWWEYRNSVFRMTVTRGHKVEIVFAYPRSDLQKYGITPGTVLFSGERVSTHQIAGTGTLRSKYCRPTEFTLRGYLAANGDALVLRGVRPGYDARVTCRVVFPRHESAITLRRIDRPAPSAGND